MKRVSLIFVLLVTIFALLLTSCASDSNTAPEADSSEPETVVSENEPAVEEVAEGGRSPFSTELLASDADPTPVKPEDLPITGIGAEVATDVKANEPYKIAIIVKNTTNPFLLKSIEGAMAAGEDTGVEVVSLSPARQDSLEDQVKLIEDAIQQGVQGIVLHPIDSNGIMPVIRKCDEAGIPVAVIGTPATYETFMRTGVDYTETGRTIGGMVAEKLGGSGKVIILEGPPGAQNANERLAGIQEALAKYPGIEIVASQTTNFKRIEGLQVTENLLQKYPDVDAIIAANDESLLGALQALKAAGIEDVVLGGFDGNQDASAAVQDGDIYATYNVDPFGSTYLATVYLVMWLNDGTMPPKYFVPFPSTLQDPVITADNIDYYIENIAWWK